jgi:hypothetical protein
LEDSIDGSTTLEDLDGGSIVLSRVEAVALVLESLSGDFFLTRGGFGASVRGCAGTLVFLTTTGGIE